MKQATKAALLSGLIFPGVGQISTGHKKRGWLIIVVTCIVFYLIVNEIVKKALSMVEEMQSSGEIIDIEKISNTTSNLVGFSDNIFLNTLLVVLIIGWLASITDAYWIANK